MIDWLLNDWYYIIFAIVGLILISYGIMSGKCKEWLKWAVSYAEQYLKSGTGQLKLRYVYDLFVKQFPVFSRIVPFAIFSKWVDLALEWMKIQLEQNPNIKAVIEGDSDGLH